MLELPKFVSKQDNDNIRVYKIIGKGQVTTFGVSDTSENDDVIII